MAPEAASLEAPPAASARAYLRSGLPSVYRETPGDGGVAPFAMRFVEGLERVLDPIVALLDQLPAHLDLKLAPPEVVDTLGGWLGLDVECGLDDDARRELVRHAPDIHRRRGTPAGIAQLLELALGEDAGLEVHDSGGASWSRDREASRPAPPPTLTVTHPPDLSHEKRETVRRLVAEVKPAHVTVELRERAEAAS